MKTICVVFLAAAISASVYAQALQIATPAGGETYHVSQYVHITWAPDPESNDIHAYLETKNANGTFASLGECLQGAKGSIWWSGEVGQYGNYPAPGNGYYIRLTNTVTGEMSRMANPFTLLPRPTVDIEVNGSDSAFKVAAGGANYTITWSSSNANYCDLYINTNGTESAYRLAPSGSQTFFIPEPTSSWGGYVNIDATATDTVTTSSGYAFANDSISIEPAQVTVQSPNGKSAPWKQGSQQTVTFAYPRSDESIFRVYLENGYFSGRMLYPLSFTDIASTTRTVTVTAPDGLAEQLVKDRPPYADESGVRGSFNILVRAIAIDANGNQSIVSEGRSEYFTIAPADMTITVQYPKADTVIREDIGTTLAKIPIAWSTANPNGQTVQIHLLSQATGSGTIIAEQVPNNGFFEYTGKLNAGSYQVAILSNLKGGGAIAVAKSEGFFTVADTPQVLGISDDLVVVTGSQHVYSILASDFGSATFDWGDGTSSFRQRVLPDQVFASHVYVKAGTYVQTYAFDGSSIRTFQRRIYVEDPAISSEPDLAIKVTRIDSLGKLTFGFKLNPELADAKWLLKKGKVGYKKQKDGSILNRLMLEVDVPSYEKVDSSVSP